MIVSTTTSIKYYVAGDQTNAPPGYTVVSYAYQYGYSSTVVATAPVNKTSLVVDATSADFKTSVAPSGTALSAYQAELDKAMQDDSYVPTFTDATTGLPWAPPAGSSPATPSQVSAYNSGQAAKEAGDAAKTAADSAVNTAQTNYNNDPSSSNGQILADAKAKQAALTAEQAKDVAKYDQDVADSESLSGSGFSSGSAYGTKTDDELSLGLRFQSFVTDMKNTAVFSLPNQFLGNIPSSSNSVMTFNGGRYGQHSFDFASLSLLWIALKTVVLVMFGWFSIRIVSLKGGGG